MARPAHCEETAARGRFEHAYSVGQRESAANDLRLGMADIDAALTAGQKDGAT